MSEREKRKSEGENDRVMEFYDAIAGEYDAMTGFEKRFVEEKPFFRLLIERYGISRALDAGCGTGFHSLLLGQLGVNVVAVDVSKEMVHRLEQHSTAMQVPVTAVATDFAHLENAVKGKFDAVFSMGNTLAHLFTRQDLKRVLQSFYKVLNDGGIVFLQLLNYDRILKDRQRVQSVRRTGDTIFVRFYDYIADRLQFNVLTLRQSGQGFVTEMQTVPLRPVVSSELVELLGEAGFTSIRVYGGVSMTEFDQASSRDLVVVAARPSPAGRKSS